MTLLPNQYKIWVFSYLIFSQTSTHLNVQSMMGYHLDHLWLYPHYHCSLIFHQCSIKCSNNICRICNCYKIGPFFTTVHFSSLSVSPKYASWEFTTSIIFVANSMLFQQCNASVVSLCCRLCKAVYISEKKTWHHAAPLLVFVADFES